MKKFNVLFMLSFCFLNLFLEIVENTALRKIYQVKKGGPLFLIIIEDTAFYERRQADKITYFTDLDTLVRQKGSELFLGKKSKLVLNNNSAVLTQFQNKKKENVDLIFLPANETQIQQWNSYKNADKFVEIGNIIDKKVCPGLGSSEYCRMLETDWNSIREQIQILNHEKFDSVVNNFKVKYLIK